MSTAPVKVVRSEQATDLMKSIRSQLDGSKLPKLAALEGTEIVIRVADGKLNWTGSVAIPPVPCW